MKCYIILTVLAIEIVANVSAQSSGVLNYSEDAPKIISRISRYKVGDEIRVDSLQYQYDAVGNLIAITDLKRKVTRMAFSYSGADISIISTFNSDGRSSTQYVNRFMRHSNGDKIVLDYSHSRSSGNVDTVYISYHFKDNVLFRVDHFVHLNSIPFSNDKKLFKYNRKGNVESVKHITTTEDSISTFSVLEWDEMKNPMYGLNISDFIFIGYSFPFNCQGVNNPTKYIDYAGEIVEAELTYNSEGYPLTYRRKGEDFIAEEFKYNR